MRVGLLADIHGNGAALAAVLAAARREAVAELLIAGDLVGYYYAADEVLELLRGWTWTAVRGNHEDMLADWRAGRNRAAIAAKYGSALGETCERLSRAQLDALAGLPHPRSIEIDRRRVLLCHGAPWAVDRYVYPDAPAPVRARMAQADAALVVFGHTHHPVLWRQGACRVVNPGSVGQPRDGTPGACWALWDCRTGDVTLRRETYDSAPLADECRARDPAVPYLADVLTRRR